MKRGNLISTSNDRKEASTALIIMYLIKMYEITEF